MTDLLQTGLTITAIGMGVVFLLLTLLVGVIRGMSALALALGGEPAPTPPAAGATAANSDEDVMPVIAAAIGAYRKHRDS